MDQQITSWCVQELGAAPIDVLLTTTHMSDVIGLRLDDGREVVIKSRPDHTRRAAACLAVQRCAAEAGFPCAKPLTEVTYRNDLALHAEEWRPGGEILRGDGPEIAERFAHLLADLIAITRQLALSPPLPNPPWVRWDNNAPIAPAPTPDSLPHHLNEMAKRLRARLMMSYATPSVLGHADWESQNLRWTGDLAHAVHDWDSVAWMPEAALVGFASGAFASCETPLLAPIPSSEAFIAAYEERRGHPFTDEEREAAWAASLWLAVHNARAELMNQWPTVSLDGVLAQGDERLRRARA